MGKGNGSAQTLRKPIAPDPIPIEVTVVDGPARCAGGQRAIVCAEQPAVTVAVPADTNALRLGASRRPARRGVRRPWMSAVAARMAAQPFWQQAAG